jgi:hypothetical protein
MMTLRRFQRMADSYGAALQRWPDASRAAAEALLQVSAEARRLLAEARALDEMLQAASTRNDAARWSRGGQAAALARLRSGVAARIAAPMPRQPSAERPLGQTLRAMFAHRRWVGMATGSGFAVVAGLVIGSLYAPAPVEAPMPSGLLHILED